jgi:hypothetical protein
VFSLFLVLFCLMVSSSDIWLEGKADIKRNFLKNGCLVLVVVAIAVGVLV